MYLMLEVLNRSMQAVQRRPRQLRRHRRSPERRGRRCTGLLPCLASLPSFVGSSNGSEYDALRIEPPSTTYPPIAEGPFEFIKIYYQEYEAVDPAPQMTNASPWRFREANNVVYIGGEQQP